MAMDSTSLRPSSQQTLRCEICTTKRFCICSTSPSVNTDDSEGVQTNPSSPTTPTTSLRRDIRVTFPAIFRPVEFLEKVSETQLESVPPLAAVFIRCINDVLCVLKWPADTCETRLYTDARDSTIRARDRFYSQSQKISSGISKSKRRQALDRLLRFMNQSLACLGELMRAVDRELAPLPPLPHDTDATHVDEQSMDHSSPIDISPTSMSPIDISPTSMSAIDISPTSMTAPAGPTRVRTQSLYSLLSRKVSGKFNKLPSMGNLRSISLRQGRGITKESTPAITRTNSDSSTQTLQDDVAGAFNEPLRKASIDDIGTSVYSLSTSDSPLQDDVVDEIALRRKEIQAKRKSMRMSFASIKDPVFDLQTALGGSLSDVKLNTMGNLESASVPVIIRMMTSGNVAADFDFMDMFFLCFRLYISPKTLVALLIERWNEACRQSEKNPSEDSRLQSDHVQMGVATVIQMWIELHWRPVDDRGAFDSLLKFAVETMMEDLPCLLTSSIVDALHSCARQGLHRRDNRVEHRLRAVKSTLQLKAPPSVALDSRVRKDLQRQEWQDVDILAFRNNNGLEEIARQMTLIDSEMHRSVLPEDIFHLLYISPDMAVAEKLHSISTRSNNIALWVYRSLLEKSSPADRAKVYECFADLAQHCLNLRNFFAASSLHWGLGGVWKLYETRTRINPDHFAIYDALSGVFSPGNLNQYRAILASSKLPTVPHFAIFLKDLKGKRKIGGSCMQEGRKLVKVAQFRAITELVRDMDQWYLGYNFTPVNNLQAYLKHCIGDASFRESDKMIDECKLKLAELEAKPAQFQEEACISLSHNLPVNQTETSTSRPALSRSDTQTSANKTNWFNFMAIMDSMPMAVYFY